MAAKYPRFIITVNGQQATMAWSHDEAWTHTLALWHPGCVVRCEPIEADAEAEPVPDGLPPEPAATQ